MKFPFLALTVLTVGCGGSSTGTSGGDQEEDPKPRCELNADCPQNTTPFCVEGVCLSVQEVPPCSDEGDCSAGFHCSPDNLCLGGCENNSDCCPDGMDCTCPDGVGCDNYECVSDGRCRQVSLISDCTSCTDMGWNCLDTAPECYLADLCNLPGDCVGGLIYIDNRCTDCTTDEQCPLTQTCQNGVCKNLIQSSGAVVNTLCDNDADCTHVDDGYCSEQLNPRRCEIV